MGRPWAKLIARQMKKKPKYGNTRTTYSGLSFASKLEAAVYQVLKLRERAGELKIIKAQDKVYLSEARIGYVPDFQCQDIKSGKTFWVEAKGFEGPRWAIIKKLWKHFGLGRLEVWKGTHLHPKLVEEIIPANGEPCDAKLA